jgi:hypothetical protein
MWRAQGNGCEVVVVASSSLAIHKVLLIAEATHLVS